MFAFSTPSGKFEPNLVFLPQRVFDIRPFKLLGAFEIEAIFVLLQYLLENFCLKLISETHDIFSSCRLFCMLSKSGAVFTVYCISGDLWPKNVEIHLFLKCFHAVLYIALKTHIPLPRFSETFSMWCRGIFGTKWHRFHYCCNLWWVQSLYGMNTLDYELKLTIWEKTLCLFRQKQYMGLLRLNKQIKTWDLQEMISFRDAEFTKISHSISVVFM